MASSWRVIKTSPSRKCGLSSSIMRGVTRLGAPIFLTNGIFSSAISEPMASKSMNIDFRPVDRLRRRSEKFTNRL